MKSLKEFINKVKLVGSIFDYNGPLSMSDYDDIFNRFNSMGVTGGEIMMYASPSFVEKLSSSINAYFDKSGVSAGRSPLKWDKINSWSFLVELSVLRGSYTVHVCPSNIRGAIMIPSFPESEWGEDNLAKKSIIIK